LALGPGGRIWARVNGGAQLFTRLTDDPVGFFQGVPTNLASGILDFCVVPGLTKVPPIWRVYTIQGGEVGMFNWDEDQRRGLGRMSLGRPLGADVVAIAATTRSRFWALTRPHTLAQLEHSGTAVTVKGGDSSDRYTNARLVANGENLFVYGGKNLSANILVIPHGFTEWKDGKPSAADKALSGPGYPGDGSRAWCIPGPTPDLGVPPQWPGYNDLFASDDGSLLALISWKAYRWIDGQWSAEPGSPAPRFSLCTRPVPGWEEFLKLRDMFSNMVGNPAPT